MVRRGHAIQEYSKAWRFVNRSAMAGVGELLAPGLDRFVLACGCWLMPAPHPPHDPRDPMAEDIRGGERRGEARLQGHHFGRRVDPAGAGGQHEFHVGAVVLRTGATVKPRHPTMRS